jgi:periplasmic protein CpxP/Spy
VMLAGAAPLVLAQNEAQHEQPRRGPGAPGGRGMRGPGFGGLEFRNLDLSDDQKAQLKKIRDARQAELKAAADKIGTARQGMRALIEADSINEGAIRAKSAEIAAAEADMLILNAKIRKEAMQILTAEQLAKLKEQGTGRRGPPRQRRPQAQ